MVIHLVVSTWEQGWRSWSSKGGVFSDRTLDQTLLGFIRSSSAEKARPQSLTELCVIPSVLRPKQTIKSCHEHHVYVIMHVIEDVDKFLVT